MVLDLQYATILTSQIQDLLDPKVTNLTPAIMAVDEIEQVFLEKKHELGKFSANQAFKSSILYLFIILFLAISGRKFAYSAQDCYKPGNGPLARAKIDDDNMAVHVFLKTIGITEEESKVSWTDFIKTLQESVPLTDIFNSDYWEMGTASFEVVLGMVVLCILPMIRRHVRQNATDGANDDEEQLEDGLEDGLALAELPPPPPSPTP